MEVISGKEILPMLNFSIRQTYLILVNNHKVGSDPIITST